jgi:endonuclease/exonuclease/phosphatase (EEP) superfamily protein YafD
MIIATWNLNHRAGTRPVRLEAANLATGFGADVLVLTEFFPRQHERQFRATLAHAGWSEQAVSSETREGANRVLIASTLPLVAMTLELPTFDQRFPANLLGVKLPSLGLSILGVRVPAYQTAPLRHSAWDWIQVVAASVRSEPFIMAGDLNASRHSKRLRRILDSGYHRADPGGPTFFGYNGRTSEIDHVLATSHCIITDARCVRDSAVSDHAAVICRVELESSNAQCDAIPGTVSRMGVTGRIEAESSGAARTDGRDQEL